MPRTLSSPLTDTERARLISRPAQTSIDAVVNRKSALSTIQKWNITVADMMKSVLLEPSKELDEKGQQQTRFKRVTRALVEEAEAGSVEAAKVIFERLEGRPAQTIHHDGQIELSWRDLVKEAITVSHRVVSDEEDLGD